MMAFFKNLFKRARRQSQEEQPVTQIAEPSPSERNSSDYSGDQPIRHRAQDRFERWSFAERVARTLAERRDPSSVVVGIYGAWGDGKTSTLSLMQEALKKHPNSVIVTFNPWQFESQEQLLRSFFDTLAVSLGKSLPTQKEKVGKLLHRYGGILSLLSVGIGGVVTVSPGDSARSAGEALSTVELDELKERVEKILDESKRRVVVFIDDIDRLDRSEIQSIFKLVKLSASFNHISYVLAFDDEMVAAALGEKYGSGGGESGRSFLEKIVQVPLHLPPADQMALRHLVFEGVDAALKLSGIGLSPFQSEAFVRHYVDGLEPGVITPRQARLYGNVLTFALPILKGEVNPVDQMLIEGIRILYPKLYVLIRDNRQLFMTRRQEQGNRDAVKQQALERINAALAGTGVSADLVVRRLLKVLFPRLETVLGNMTYAHDWDQRWAREQRICSEEYFDRYFGYAVPPGDVSDKEIAAFVEQPSSVSEADLQDELVRIAGTNGIRTVISKLRRIEDTIAVAAIPRLAIVLARMGRLVPREKAMLANDWSSSQTAILIAHLIKRIQDAQERDALAKRVVNEAEPLFFATECFRWLRKGSDEPEQGRIVTQETEEESGKLLAGRIEAASKAAGIYDAFGPDTPRMLWFWNRYALSGTVGNYLRGRLDADPSEVIRLLDSYVGTAWGLESGLSHKADFERHSYDAIAELIDPSFVFEKLRLLYPNLSGAEYRYAGDGEYESTLAEQFAFLHKKVIEEVKAKKVAAEGKKAAEGATRESQVDTTSQSPA
jgi:hypothetical protein